EEKTKNLLENTSNEIKARAAQAEKEVLDYAQAVYKQEFPAGQALALSNIPLDGLGSLWTDIRDTVTGALKDVNKAVTRVIVVPTKKVGEAVIRGAEGVATAVGYEHGAEQLSKFREEGDKLLDEVQHHLENPIELMTGEETYNVARDKANELKAQSLKEIAEGKAKAIQTLNSPAYRGQLQIDIAKTIRNDPQMMSA